MSNDYKKQKSTEKQMSIQGSSKENKHQTKGQKSVDVPTTANVQSKKTWTPGQKGSNEQQSAQAKKPAVQGNTSTKNKGNW